MFRNARGAIDNPLFEILEIPPAGTSRVGNRHDSSAQREPVGVHAVVACIRVAFSGAGIDVHVNIDQPGDDVESADADGLGGQGGIDTLSDSRDPAILDSDVPHRADPILGVDEMSALQQQLISALGEAATHGREQHQPIQRLHAGLSRREVYIRDEQPVHGAQVELKYFDRKTLYGRKTVATNFLELVQLGCSGLRRGKLKAVPFFMMQGWVRFASLVNTVARGG
jgi:hypothetical protein